MNIGDNQIWLLANIQHYCDNYNMSYWQIVELLSEVSPLYQKELSNLLFDKIYKLKNEVLDI